MRYRLGRHNARILYRQLTDDPSDSDDMVATFFDATDAIAVMRLLNDAITCPCRHRDRAGEYSCRYDAGHRGMHASEDGRQWTDAGALVPDMRSRRQGGRGPVALELQPAGEPAHPESWCHRCGGLNIIWAAPSPLWNAVMRGGSIDGVDEHDGIVCPICFAQLAEERGIAHLWRFDAERVTADLETVTPSGRVWDSTAWRWAEPTEESASVPPPVAEISRLLDEFGERSERIGAVEARFPDRAAPSAVVDGALKAEEAVVSAVERLWAAGVAEGRRRAGQEQERTDRIADLREWLRFHGDYDVEISLWSSFSTIRISVTRLGREVWSDRGSTWEKRLDKALVYVRSLCPLDAPHKQDRCCAAGQRVEQPENVVRMLNFRFIRPSGVVLTSWRMSSEALGGGDTFDVPVLPDGRVAWGPPKQWFPPPWILQRHDDDGWTTFAHNLVEEPEEQREATGPIRHCGALTLHGPHTWGIGPVACPGEGPIHG